jgi:serine/threonine protein kinase
MVWGLWYMIYDPQMHYIALMNIKYGVIQKCKIFCVGQIVSILGKQDLLKYCDQYGIQLSTELQKVVQKYTLKTNATGARKSWLTLLNSSTKPIRGKDLGSKNSPCPIPSREGLNLLDKLLVYNHEERLTAKEAMMHPFFDAVRDKVRIEIQNRWVKEHSM